MSLEFPTLIGQFIHHCDAIELLINKSIRALSTDNILSSNTSKLPLSKRINLLQKLLAERSEIKGNVINKLCKDLHNLRKQRNIVAHNPIIQESTDKSASQEILVLRYKSEGVTFSDKLTENGLRNLVTESNKLMIRFTELISETVAT